MRVKDSIVVWHLFAPEMYEALATIDDVYVELTGDEAVLTSGKDSTHMQGSLHYVGRAGDFRLPKELPADDVIKRIRAVLGGAFDVVLEANHIHVEYDPEG